LAAHTLLWLAQGSLSPQTFTPATSGDAAHSSAWWLGFTPETTA
jgi:hypothetical protein